MLIPDHVDNRWGRPSLARTTCVPLLALIALLIATVQVAPARAQHQALPTLSANQVADVRAEIAAMKQRDKGPYLRIRWYCRDGAVLPPTPYACSKRGGGEQHASYTDDADRLQALGFDVGTILVALPYEQFEDARRGHYRLRELVLEDYLVDNDDGWVLRGARYYRGARQIESEERYGRRHLVRLLSDPAWRRDNPLLATQLVAAVPHGQPGVPGDRIRELATQMARLNPELMDLRIKIHSSPGPDDLDAVRAAANSAQRRSSMMRRTLAELQDQLQTLYSADLDEHRWASLASELDELDRTDLTAEMRAAAAAIRGGTVRQQVAELSRLLLAARRGYNQLGSGSRAGAQALHVLDLINYGDALLRSSSNSWLASRRTPSGGRASRAEYLAFVENLTDAAYGSGWLTEREHVALRAQPSGRDLPAEDYRKRVEYLGNAVLWGQAALRQTYGEPLLRYRQVEPAARGFEDGMLRGSVLLALSNVIDDLSHDASLAAGVRHSVFDAPPPGRVMALNTGVARGRLYVVDDERDLGRLDPRGIYVLPKTVLDLGRVAGILTLDEGSRLSHIQLLARSLGIPNAAISAQLLPQLRAYAGREVFFSVGQDGGVVVGRGDDLRTVDAELLRQRSQQPAAGIAIDADRLDLDEQRLFTLDEVGPEDSGRVIGPKAANLAKLRSFFPDRVEQGLVIPVRRLSCPHRARPAEHRPFALHRAARHLSGRRGRTAAWVQRRRGPCPTPTAPASDSENDTGHAAAARLRAPTAGSVARALRTRWHVRRFRSLRHQCRGPAELHRRGSQPDRDEPHQRRRNYRRHSRCVGQPIQRTLLHLAAAAGDNARARLPVDSSAAQCARRGFRSACHHRPGGEARRLVDHHGLGRCRRRGRGRAGRDDSRAWRHGWRRRVGVGFVGARCVAQDPRNLRRRRH